MNSFLTTLRRVPDDIVLSVASREVIPDDFNACLCGWFVRESIARMAGADASETRARPWDVEDDCVKAFGGRRTEWGNIFYGVASPHFSMAIEEAFAERVLECVA